MRLLILIFALFLHFVIISQCYLSNEIMGGMHIENTTGDKNLDAILLEQKKGLESVFPVKVDLYFGVERNRSGNAFFHPSCKSLYCNGRVVLGLFLMQELSKKSDSYIRLVSVFAHEYGHAMQQKYGWSGNGKWRELHADYLAGYYMGLCRLSTESEILSIFTEFANRGDFSFNDPGHHGTPEERSCAFIEGFKYAYSPNTNIYSAYNTGKSYVISNNPCNKYRNVASSGYYLPPVSGELFAIYLAAYIVMVSNDIYIQPNINFYPYQKDELIGGRIGWSIGLRKQFMRSSLEYGFSTLGGRASSFDMNYIHDIQFKRIPDRIQPYIGLGMNAGTYGFGMSGQFGLYLPLLNRWKVDLRYKLGNRINQVQLGLIFKYQKEYFWNKSREKF